MAPLLRVLIVDDDEEDFLILRHALAPKGEGDDEDFQIEWVPDWESGLAALRAARHDVFLVDYKIGADSGVDLLRAAREEGIRLPAIMLTGADTPELSQLALAAGAVDFLVKGRITREQLSRSLRYAVANNRRDAQINDTGNAFRLMFDKNPIPAWTVDLDDGRILSFNQAMAALSGLAPGEIADCGQLQLRPSANNPGAGFMDRLRMAEGPIGEWDYRSKDGGLRNAEISSQTLAIEGQSFRLVFANDITQQKMLEERLRASEQQKASSQTAGDSGA